MTSGPHRQRHHVVISGTGRAGTTALVRLLTALGCDTGFDSPSAPVAPVARAGLELQLEAPDAPYIVKSPWLCETLGGIVEAGGITIDHAIVPIRSLTDAAASRRAVEAATPRHMAGDDGNIPGGLWGTTEGSEQEAVLAQRLHQLLEVIVRHEIPLTLLDFPRFARDPDYLWPRLRFLFEDVGEGEFRAAFGDVMDPGLVRRESG